jgi:hypothetical protein
MNEPSLQLNRLSPQQVKETTANQIDPWGNKECNDVKANAQVQRREGNGRFLR